MSGERAKATIRTRASQHSLRLRRTAVALYPTPETETKLYGEQDVLLPDTSVVLAKHRLKFRTLR